jgi:hypothetical protein
VRWARSLLFWKLTILGRLDRDRVIALRLVSGITDPGTFTVVRR